MLTITRDHLLPQDTFCCHPFMSFFLPKTWLAYDDVPLPPTQRASRTRKYPEMARDYNTTQDFQIKRDTPPAKPPSQKDQPPHTFLRHSLTFIGIGMLIALFLVVATQLTGNWLSNTVDDIRYGNPRTFQIDAFVGHETGKTPSHFIALNLHGRIQIIELPGGDATKAKIYPGPQLYDANAERIPVKLQFIDTHHNHRPDMYVQFGGTQIIFRNTPTGFQSP
ncbi:MAG TPA: hypothetical protein VL485_03295 [Ktedonobacteraceae bacterium]|jgi:hypothetical protein|nr:hypothetical protein [Ktedonobacteraceae bacterium]